MIISHKYKFIFVKTVKTAGTSIEIALSEFCGADDIITPIGEKDEALRKEQDFGGPRHYKLPFRQYQLIDWMRLLAKRRILKFQAHVPAREIKRLISANVWNSYFKFCFERNPWDKVISLYYWNCSRNYHDKPWPSISEFINSGRLERVRAFDLYSIDGEVIVDRVGRFENLQEDLNAIAEQIGLPGKPGLLKAKGGYRQDKRHYRELLSSHDREKISQVFHREIEAFGYEF